MTDILTIKRNFWCDLYTLTFTDQMNRNYAGDEMDRLEAHRVAKVAADSAIKDFGRTWEGEID